MIDAERCSSRATKPAKRLCDEIAGQQAGSPLEADPHYWPKGFVRGMLSDKQLKGIYGPKPKPSTICPAIDLFQGEDHEQRRVYVPAFVVDGLLVTKPFNGQSLPKVCLQSPAHSSKARQSFSLHAHSPLRALHAPSTHPPRALHAPSTQPPPKKTMNTRTLTVHLVSRMMPYDPGPL